VESREECLQEAMECERLAALAQTRGTRMLMLVAARQWRQLAQKATERQATMAHLMAAAASRGA
jgi:hypothetical protein